MFHSRWVRLATTGALLIVALGVALVLYVGNSEIASGAGPEATNSTAASSHPSGYVVLAWNDLGMHCYDRDYQVMGVLPPFNTLWAQVIKVGDPPQIVTSGVTVEYSFADNTYSVGKTNFWTYAQKLFNLPQPLPDNVGLKGKGLSGEMDAAGDHFTATGIPLTEFSDSNPQVADPYQMATIVVKNADTGEELTRAEVVAPISSELGCFNCHADDGDATTKYPITPTGDVRTNILALHDYLSQAKYPAGNDQPLMDRQPVLCAECHSSNALGAAGVQGISSLSNAMHNHHKDLMDITPDTEGCYKCHPGPNTQCLRDTMSGHFSLTCVNCHGDMAQVASNPNPWLNEPQCANATCHGSGYQLNQALYRQSQGHGSVYCAGCHDSPHAIAPSREEKDGLKFVALQGNPGTLRDCTVCHATTPTTAFQHRINVASGPLSDPNISYFAETQHNLGYGFRFFWENNGGLARFGYPLTEERVEVSPTDGQPRTVQYFERARFEYHPEYKGTAWEVQLALLGRELTQGMDFASSQPFENRPDSVFFPETQHSLSNAFLAYWQEHGGLAVFGYPISEERVEINPSDGKAYTVQYFERNRFEYHPEAVGTENEVQLGQLGREMLMKQGRL
jgi:hypothetical protein